MLEGALQPIHWLVVAAIALIFFGPQRVPELGKSLGKAISAAREAERIGRPKADRTLKCASSLPVRAAALERPQVHVQFLGESIEWQELVLPLVMNDRVARPLQYGCGDD